MTTDPRPTGLTVDEVLRTTRSVRRRLDLDRSVDPAVVDECIEVALQAPTGSNAQAWHFVTVTDQGVRAGLAELYRRAWDLYATTPFTATGVYTGDDEERKGAQQRVVDSGLYLAEHLAEVPVHVIPCIEGRIDGQPSPLQAPFWGSILPATWSLMLAARSRGLASAYTTLHLLFEEEAADLLGIPFAEITQAALIPIAQPKGSMFKPAPREPVASVLHRDTW